MTRSNKINILKIRLDRIFKAGPDSGYSSIIKNKKFEFSPSENTNKYPSNVTLCKNVLPDLTLFREGGVMTCQSPRDTLTGMWGNLVYHVWGLSGQHTNKTSCIHPHPATAFISTLQYSKKEKELVFTAMDNLGLLYIFL